MSAPALSALLTALAGIGVILPQITRVTAVGDASGVAAAGITGSVFGYAGWLIYTSRGPGGWSLVALALPAALQAVNLLVVVRYGGDRSDIAPIVVLGTAVCLAVAIGPLNGAVWVLLAIGAMAYVPTVRSAWRAPTIRGVSRVAWTLSTLHAVGWGVHGVAISDAFIITNGAINTAGSVLVLLATFVRHEEWHRPVDACPGLR